MHICLWLIYFKKTCFETFITEDSCFDIEALIKAKMLDFTVTNFLEDTIINS